MDDMNSTTEPEFNSRESTMCDAARRIRAKNPGRIPIICQADVDKGLPGWRTKRTKFLVSEKLNVSQFRRFVRSNLVNSEASSAADGRVKPPKVQLYLESGAELTEDLMNITDLDNLYRDDDGFLYLTYITKLSSKMDVVVFPDDDPEESKKESTDALLTANGAAPVSSMEDSSKQNHTSLSQAAMSKDQVIASNEQNLSVGLKESLGTGSHGNSEPKGAIGKPPPYASVVKNGSVEGTVSSPVASIAPEISQRSTTTDGGSEHDKSSELASSNTESSLDDTLSSAKPLAEHSRGVDVAGPAGRALLQGIVDDAIEKTLQASHSTSSSTGASVQHSTEKMQDDVSLQQLHEEQQSDYAQRIKQHLKQRLVECPATADDADDLYKSPKKVPVSMQQRSSLPDLNLSQPPGASASKLSQVHTTPGSSPSYDDDSDGEEELMMDGLSRHRSSDTAVSSTLGDAEGNGFTGFVSMILSDDSKATTEAGSVQGWNTSSRESMNDLSSASRRIGLNESHRPTPMLLSHMRQQHLQHQHQHQQQLQQQYQQQQMNNYRQTNYPPYQEPTQPVPALQASQASIQNYPGRAEGSSMLLQHGATLPNSGTVSSSGRILTNPQLAGGHDEFYNEHREEDEDEDAEWIDVDSSVQTDLSQPSLKEKGKAFLLRKMEELDLQNVVNKETISSSAASLRQLAATLVQGAANSFELDRRAVFVGTGASGRGDLWDLPSVGTNQSAHAGQGNSNDDDDNDGDWTCVNFDGGDESFGARFL